jgi:hypothetical protein
MVAVGMFVLAIFVPTDNSGSYSWLSNDVDQAVRLLFLVLLPMVIEYFNGCARARSLGIAVQIKIMGESMLIYSGLSFCTPSGFVYKTRT